MKDFFYCVFISQHFSQIYWSMTLTIFAVIIIKIIKNLTSSDVILFITKIYTLHDIQQSNGEKTLKTLENCKLAHVRYQETAG